MPKISDPRREARRRQVLEAALSCFSENGFHQTGMADIVQRSRMSRGAVYGYFRSKDDIIEALADDRREIEAELNAAARSSDDPVQALRAIVRAYARSLLKPSDTLRRRVGVHGWAEALRSERVRARVVEGIDIPRSLIGDLVETAQRTGALSQDVKAEAVARTFIAIFQGFVLQIAWGEAIDAEAVVAVVERMLQGLIPADPSARQATGWA
jgi:AcrR family transcriptional regulator